MSDLISREEAIKINESHHGEMPNHINHQIWNELKKLPPADIMECARAIKENCEQFSECEGCRFYNNLPFRCTFGICPQEWKLPEGEKE